MREKVDTLTLPSLPSPSAATPKTKDAQPVGRGIDAQPVGRGIDAQPVGRGIDAHPVGRYGKIEEDFTCVKKTIKQFKENDPLTAIQVEGGERRIFRWKFR